MPNIESNDAFNMLSQIQSHTRLNNSELIQKKDKIEKEQLNREEQTRLLAQQDDFFAQLIQLFLSKKNSAQLLQNMLALLNGSGFANEKEALNLAKNSNAQSPLLYAFQTQNFALAKQLMDRGALAGPAERAAFYLALDSKAAQQFGFTAEYRLTEQKLHPVKKYGLTLGVVMTAQDGTSSQFAHIGPSYKMMTDIVSNYAKSKLDNPSFDKIAEAYQFSNKAAAFVDSTSKRDPLAGREIAARIQEGKLTTIPINFEGHAMGLSVVPAKDNPKSGYLVFTNRGLGKTPDDDGTKIYKIDDLSKLDERFINMAMNGHSRGISHEQIMGEIHNITEGKPPIHTIKQKDQKCDNCAIANTKANIHGIILCQRANEKGGFANLTTEDFTQGKKSYKEFTQFMRQEKVDSLVKDLQESPNNPDLNKLARSYLDGHPNAASRLREPLEKILSENVTHATPGQPFLSQMR